MADGVAYARWKRMVFWGGWLLLLAPAYCAAFGVWLVGSMLLDYRVLLVDIVLTAIMALTFVLVMSVAVYTFWHFTKSTRSYTHLMLSLLSGLLLIPMLSALGAIYSYVQLA